MDLVNSGGFLIMKEFPPSDQEIRGSKIDNRIETLISSYAFEAKKKIIKGHNQ